AVLGCLTDDVAFIMPGPSDALPFAGTYRGHAGVMDLFQRLLTCVAFERLDPQEFIAQGDVVVVLGEARSRFLATSRVVEHQWVGVFRRKGGGVAAYRVYEDTAALAAAARAGS